MLVQNNRAAPVNLNLRDGRRYHIGAGRQITLPDSYTALLDDNASTIALFNTGVLTALTDAGAPFPNFPTSVNAADAKAGRTETLSGIYDQNGSLTLSGASAGAVRSVSGSGTINPTAVFYIPGRQFVGSQSAKDYSGNSADAVIQSGTTDAEVWANNGYITTKAATAGKLDIPLAKSAFNLGGESVIFSAVIKKAAPTVSEAIMGHGSAGAGAYGFYLSARATTGKIRVIPNTTGGAVTGLTDSTAVFCDGTDHHILVAFDFVTGEIKIFRDGALSDAYPANSYVRGGASNPVVDFAIGGASGAGSTGYAGQFYGIQLYKKAGVGLPSNLALIAQRLASAPAAFLPQGSLLW